MQQVAIMQQAAIIASLSCLGAVLSWPLMQLRDSFVSRRGLEQHVAGKAERICLPIGLGIAFGAAAGFMGAGLPLANLLVVLCICVLIAMLDIEYRIIPNSLIAALIAVRIVFWMLGMRDVSWLSSIVGFAACFIVFMLPSLWGRTVGAGDVKLAAAMGFSVGLSGGLVAIAFMGAFVLAYWVAAHSLPTLIQYQKLIPMGPFLGAGLVVALAIGPVAGLLAI